MKTASKLKTMLLLAASAGFFAAAAPASATIAIGDSLEIQYLYPTVGSVYQTNTTTFTGPGTTLPVIYTGNATFSSTNVLINAPASYNPADFNGLEISDLTNPAAFAGWGVLPDSTQTSGFSYSQDVSGNIFVNWQGASITGTIDLGAVGAPAPIPGAGLASLAAMAIGAFRARKRRA
jgi:hypothetical protein